MHLKEVLEVSMKVEYIKLCKDAEVINGEQKIIDAFDTIQTESLPIAFDRFYVAAKVFLNEEDIDLIKKGIYLLELRVKDPFGKINHDHPIRIDCLDVDFLNDDVKEFTKFIKFGLNGMPFRLYGTYTVDLTLQFEPIATATLTVQEIKTTINI